MLMFIKSLLTRKLRRQFLKWISSWLRSNIFHKNIIYIYYWTKKYVKDLSFTLSHLMVLSMEELLFSRWEQETSYDWPIKWQMMWLITTRSSYMNGRWKMQKWNSVHYFHSSGNLVLYTKSNEYERRSRYKSRHGRASKKAFDGALDLTNLLITLSTGTLALTFYFT